MTAALQEHSRAGAGSAPFAFPPGLDLRSVPTYKRLHQGPALVVGSAACALSDFEAGRKLYSDALVMAVNRTAGWIKADFLVSIDRRQAQQWREAHEGRFGRGHFTMHGGKFGAGQTGPGAYPWFDHWWPGLQSGGTSAWLGAKILAVMGCAPIVLCGVPLERMAYLDGEDNWTRRDDKQLEAYREPMRRDSWMRPLVSSLSGWTREWFGPPA